MLCRNFASVDEFKACVAGETEIILDGSKQATHRPSQTQVQTDYYSGRKKTYTQTFDYQQ
ncbi:hypothetical protein QE357_003460 [Siphonobacter sp. BAB-5404]|nr:hypothetical protein [Siphonobacter sp. SORGH_AS_0500]